jgi:hypothetical protein
MFTLEREFQECVLGDLKMQYPYGYHFNANMLARGLVFPFFGFIFLLVVDACK